MGMRRKHPLARLAREEGGAAVAEFAITMVLIVPLVMYALWVGEAYMAGAKAQEAEITAAWDATAYLLHDYQNKNHRPLYDAAASRVEGKVKKDLEDFTSYADTGRTEEKGLVATHKLKSLECVRRTSSAAGTEPFAAIVNGFLHEDGYIGCAAKISYENHFLPRRALDELTRNADLFPSSLDTLQLCGLGSGVNGCKASKAPGMLVLADDYGLEQGQQNRIGTSENRRYFNVAQASYQLTGYQAGSIAVNDTMLELLLLNDQGQTSTFKMGYLTPIYDRQNVASDQGPREAHMSPWDETACDETDNVSGVSERVYNERVDGHYLGKRQDNYNAP